VLPVVRLAVVLLAAAAPATSPSGMYQTHQMEVGAGLELKPNHHFRYALSYGAVDEEGEGVWTFDGTSVRLTSKPMPNRPAFELVRDDPAPKGQLFMALEDPGFEWGHGLEAVAATESGPAFEVTADDTGRVDLADRPPIRSIAPEMPVFGPTGDVFPLTPDRGHRLLFRFHRNDLGHARFDGEVLRREGRDLLLQRYDTVFRFVKVRP
jgi:hypothetical protein